MNDVYSFNKAHASTGFDSTIQHLEKCHSRVYGVRLYKATLRLLLMKDECTKQMLCEVENKENLIAAPRGYDSARKHLVDCGYLTELYENEIPSTKMDV